MFKCCSGPWSNDSPHHAVCRGKLERLRSRPREMALSELILAAVVRIGSNPRVFRNEGSDDSRETACGKVPKAVSVLQTWGKYSSDPPRKLKPI
jgi:hypothetical protein